MPEPAESLSRAMKEPPRYDGFLGKLKALKILLPHLGMLRQRGLAGSVAAMIPMDAGGNPLPWMSYPFIDYVTGLDLSACRLFEFGSGNSTRYWATRCLEVLAVESDPGWYEKIAKGMPSNARVVFGATETEYLSAIDAGGPYDIVVVDGALNRRKMAEKALQHVKADGFVVLDNSDVWVSAADTLRNGGLIQVDLTGFAPAAQFEQTTSIFLRPAFRPKPRGRFLPAKTPWCMRHIIEE
jgi:hypothetical protein